MRKQHKSASIMRLNRENDLGQVTDGEVVLPEVNSNQGYMTTPMSQMNSGNIQRVRSEINDPDLVENRPRRNLEPVFGAQGRRTQGIVKPK